MNDAEREAYLLTARLPAFGRKVEQSKEIIRRALKEKGRWVLSFSGGKDSTVLADLLFQCGWKGAGIYFWYSKYENPSENDRQVQWARNEYGFDIQKHRCYGSYDAWKEVGHFFVIPETENEKTAARKCAAGFKETSRSFMSEIDAQNIFMGLCKEESRARQISLNMRGPLYRTKLREGWTCCPLSNWTGTDVWAYTVSRGLPYLGIYDLPHWDRKRIRNELTVIYCSESVLRGEFTQYHLAYPELFAKLCHEFPEVKGYA